MNRWDFLIPWCEAVDFGYAGYLSFGDEKTAFDVRACRLKVIPPSRYNVWASRKKRDPRHEDFDNQDEQEFQVKVQRMREGLALMAAAAHVDKTAVRYLLEKLFGDTLGQPGDEKYEQIIPSRFLLSSCNSFEFTLVRLFGVHQRTHPTDEFLTALKRIGAMVSGSQFSPHSVDIKIPVRVVLDRPDGQIGSKLKEIARAEQIIQEQWKRYDEAQHIVDSDNVLRCTFVMEPMVADIGSHAVGTVSQLLRANVWFSHLSLRLGGDDTLWCSKLKWRESVVERMMSLFGNARRHSPKFYDAKPRDRQIGCVDVHLDNSVRKFEIEAMFSAMAFSQTTKTVRMNFSKYYHDKEARDHLWRWVTYGFFSQRACSFSAVESVNIICLDSMDDSRNTSVLSRQYPEEYLCGLQGKEMTGRFATLKAGASIRVKFREHGELKFSPKVLISAAPIDFIRTISDDGESTWLNALIPGYGHCQIQRSDVEYRNFDEVERRKRGLMSLTLGFNTRKNEKLWGLSDLVKAVGPLLKSLTLGVANLNLAPDTILESCPHLLELSLCGGVVEMYLDFREYRTRKKWPPSILKKWQDIPALCRVLMKPQYYLTQCLRRLRVHLDEESASRADRTMGPYDDARFKSDWEALQRMLKSNRVLEYLDVVLPYKCPEVNFAKYHLNPISEYPEVPLTNKLAFLGGLSRRRNSVGESNQLKKGKFQVLQSTRFPELDQFLSTQIFEFAAEHARRKVYCHVQSEAARRWEDSEPVWI